MADKQFARSGPAEFDTLADDDPLSELARIVGYDARPAVQQLQELQRHQETIRHDPAFDLEEELLRAFDSYDAPRAEPVHPDSGLIEHPVAESVSAEPSAAAEHSLGGAHVEEPHSDPVAMPLEAPHAELTSSSFAGDAASVEQEAEAPVAEDTGPSFDLERELELSLGQEDLSPEPAPRVEDIEQPASTPVAEDIPTFEDWQEPLASKLTAAVEQATLSEPVYVDLLDDLAEQGGQVIPNEALAVDAPGVGSSMREAADHVDQPSDVEHFAVSAAADVEATAFEAAPTVAVSLAPVARKSSYPFTPTFSRATPVASPAGQQRAFATPIPTAAVAEVPVVPAKSEPETHQGTPGEFEVEPNFDIENFELELADIAFDVKLSDDDERKVEAAAVQPVIAHPAMIEPVEQHFPQAVATPVVPEPHRDEPRALSVDAAEEAPAESALPFDPAMIGETEAGVAPIAELDVPSLPPVEAEEKPAAYSTDFDIDIDAEMAQLFSTPARAAKGGPHMADTAEAAGSRSATPGDAAVPLASIDDFHEFEKAMEEDFRLSMNQRRSDAPDVDQLAALPRADSDYFEEEGYGRRRSQRGMLLAASVAGVVILGGAAVYAWMGGSSATPTGDGPRIILADKEPVKIVPAEKGGKTVPNQDKAVYDRVAGETVDAPRQEALVSTTEEPMDVVQKTLTPEGLPLEGSDYDDPLPGVSGSDGVDAARLLPGDATGAAAEEERVAVAPRKVRTMIVKPDGTLVPREEPVKNAVVASVAPSVAARASAEGTSGSEGGATVAAQLATAEQPVVGGEKVALAAPTDTSVEDLTPVRSVKTTAIGGTAVPQARPEAPAAAATNGEAASQAPVETAAVAPSVPATTASVPPGSYLIQISSLPSEAEAQKSYDNLSKRYADIIGGRGVDIRRADIPGKGTYYRVRIPAGSREDANALCSRYKSAGGSCLVTK